jgi:hypothetical protein
VAGIAPNLIGMNNFIYKQMQIVIMLIKTYPRSLRLHIENAQVVYILILYDLLKQVKSTCIHFICFISFKQLSGCVVVAEQKKAGTQFFE